MDDYIDFCNLNPARTQTDCSDLEAWLNAQGIAFRHREGPAGDTVFMVPRADFERAVQLWGEYRGSGDYILSRLDPRPAKGPKRRSSI